MDGLRTPLHALCLQELQMDKERAFFQLGILFPHGHLVMDVAKNKQVGVVVALPSSQAVLNQGFHGDGSLVWVKNIKSRGELYIASIYGERR